MVRITDRPVKPKRRFVNVQMFHDQGFVKLQKSFLLVGINWLLFTIQDKTKSKQQTQRSKRFSNEDRRKLKREIEPPKKCFKKSWQKWKRGKKT
jgi:hypothetical protein